MSPAGTAEPISARERLTHTRVSLRVHCIFSTKDRDHAIPQGLQHRAWAFIGGIARRCGLTAVAVGGIADHVHILLLLPPTITLAAAVQKIKANSSRWMHEQTGRRFEWQEGYAAFSVSISQTDATVEYILNQKKHHQRRGFGEELAKILARHGMS
jgi:putative transposase